MRTNIITYLEYKAYNSLFEIIASLTYADENGIFLVNSSWNNEKNLYTFYVYTIHIFFVARMTCISVNLFVKWHN